LSTRDEQPYPYSPEIEGIDCVNGTLNLCSRHCCGVRVAEWIQDNFAIGKMLAQDMEDWNPVGHI
jgi:hypothetical protein